MTAIKGMRILDALPTFYEIYSLFRHTENARYVFVDSFTFRNDQLPSDDEYEILDKNSINIGDQIILTPSMVDMFGPRFLRIPNCIHVYDSIGKNIDSEYITFKKLNWDWAYYCYDGTLVEIFIQKNHDDAYGAIKNTFECKDIEFPGLIPDGLNILD